AMVGSQIGNWRVVRIVGQQFAAAAANRRVRIVMDLAAVQVRHMRIKQAGKRAQDAALRLAAQSEKNKIMAGQYRVHDLRYHRIVVADDAGEDGPAAAQARHQVVAHFVLDAAVAHPLFGKLRAAAKLAQGLRMFAQRLDTSRVTAAILAQRTECCRMFVLYACDDWTRARWTSAQ